MKILNLTENEIIQAVKDGKITLSVFGSGKLGLPVALAFADAGANVIAVDLNQKLVDMINKGENPHIFEPGVTELLKEAVARKKIRASSDLVSAAKDSDVMIILIPTCTDEKNELDMGPLEKAIMAIGEGLKKGDVVILESTVPPGMTEKYVREELETISGLDARSDFGLSFSPERVSSGSVLADLRKNYPKIVSGLDEETKLAVAALYRTIVEKGIITVSNLRTAEAVKVFKGIFRDVNIALANEFAKVAEKLNIDIIEVINAANSEPYCHIHLPGAGVGGHCIPVYPYFILNMEEFKVDKIPKLTQLAREINEAMPFYTINLALKTLDAINKDSKIAKIAILGLTYRGGVKETRNVPAFKIIENLKSREIDFKVFDPILTGYEIREIFDVEPEESLEAACSGRDLLIFLTDHEQFKQINLKELAKSMNQPGIILDGRQIFEPEKVIKAGLHYKGIGRVGSLE